MMYPGFGFSAGSSTVGNQLAPVRLTGRLDRILGEIGDTGGTAGCTFLYPDDGRYLRLLIIEERSLTSHPSRPFRAPRLAVVVL